MTVSQLIGVICASVAGLVALIKGVEFLAQKINAAAAKLIQVALAPTNEKIDRLDEKIDAVNRKVDKSEYEDCKNFLVSFLSKIDNGIQVTDVELERFHETYERYTGPELNGNSYVKTKVEKLKGEGKL